MKIIIKKEEIHEYIFVISYAIYIMVLILSTTFYLIRIPHYRIILALCATIVMADEILFSKYSIRSILLMALVTVMGIIEVGADTRVEMLTLVFVYCARDKNFDRIFKATLYIDIFMLLFVIVSAEVGIIPNFVYHSARGVRHYLGFRYALNAPAIVFNVIALYTVIPETKKKAASFLFLFLANIGVYVMTRSRLSFFLSILLMVWSIFISVFGENSFKKISVLLIPSYIASCLVSFYFVSLYYKANELTFIRVLNQLSDNRIKYAANSLKRYGVNLFGNDKIHWVGRGLNEYGRVTRGVYNYVDNIYVRVGQRYGLVFLGVAIMLATLLMAYYWRKQKYVYVIVLALIAFHGLIDNLIFYLHYNTFLLLIIVPFFDRTTANVKESATDKIAVNM